MATMVEPPSSSTTAEKEKEMGPGGQQAQQPHANGSSLLQTNGLSGEGALTTQQTNSSAHAGPNPPIVCPGHVRPLAEVAFSEETIDGVFLISACLDGSPMLRDGETGDWIGTFAGHKGAVWSAKLCKEARLAATGSGDFSAKLWDALTGTCVATLDHGHVVKSVDFAQDRRAVVTGGHEGVVRVWDVESTKEPSLTLIASAAKDKATGNGKTPKPPAINKVVWIPPALAGNDKTVAAGYGDGKVLIWDLRTETAVATLISNEDASNGLAARANPVMDLDVADVRGVGVLTVASGTSVKFWRAGHWGAPARDAPINAPVHFREEGGAALSPDGTKVVLGGGRHGGSRQGALGVEKGATRVGDVGSDLTVFCVDFATGDIIDERKGHCGPVRCVRFHPSGDAVATGSEDGTIRLWDVSSSLSSSVTKTNSTTSNNFNNGALSSGSGGDETT